MGNIYLDCLQRFIRDVRGICDHLSSLVLARLKKKEILFFGVADSIETWEDKGGQSGWKQKEWTAEVLKC